MGTKNQSPGSQFTSRGVVQGFWLVSHEYGRPIDSVIDNNGVLRLAVDSVATINNAVINVDLDHTTDSIAIGDGVSNIMSVNSDGTLNIRLFDEAGNAFSALNPLPVDIVGSVNIDVDLDHTGDSVRLGDGTGFITSTVVGADRALDVNVVQTVNAGVLDNQVASLGVDLGSVIAGYDGTNYQFLSVNANGRLQVDIVSLPAITLASQANPFNTDIQVDINAFSVSLPAGNNNIGNVDIASMPAVVLASQTNPFTTDINVSLAGEQVDISDRAARDLGKVDIATFDVPLPTGSNIIGKTYLTDGTLDASIVADGSINRLQTSTVLTEQAKEVKQASFRKAGISASTYYILIDRDNDSGSGPYKHTWTSGQWIYVVAAQGILVKYKPADEWDGRIGVILRIDGTNADIGWFPMGTLHARDTSEFVSTVLATSFNVPFSLEVSGGDLVDAALGWIETTATINTGITLKDIQDNDITPAIGDLIAYADQTSGSGTAELQYGIGYLVK